jgi:hypothetical protein
MVRWQSIFRAAFTKFLPGAVALIAILVGVTIVRGIQLSPRTPLIFAIEVGCLAGGYAGVLGAMRRKLRSDAAPDGRKSFIAGLAATALLLLVTELPATWHLWSLAIASFATGAGSAGLMFFPWLTRRPARSDWDSPSADHGNSFKEDRTGKWHRDRVDSHGNLV